MKTHQVCHKCGTQRASYCQRCYNDLVLKLRDRDRQIRTAWEEISTLRAELTDHKPENIRGL